MARLGHGRKSRRLWWLVGGIAAVSIAASFGTPKVGCAGSPDDEPDTPSAYDPTSAQTELDGLEHVPVARDGYAPTELSAISPAIFCPTAGGVAPVGDHALNVNVPGMRGVIAGDTSRSGELAFVFRGATKQAVPLASGEMRQQIGLKLRAQNSCNIVYVMWHILPKPGVWVSVKSNPGLATHAECADRGYTTIQPTSATAAPIIAVGAPHVLRADMDGESLRVHADGVEIWKGSLPAQAFAFDGAVGVRSDNGEFDFELRIPGGGKPDAKCSKTGADS